MDNVVTINNQKTNTLELDVSVQGLNTNDVRVWLSVSTENMDLQFECRRESGDKWVVDVPPLPFINRTAYPCSVRIIADGYFFEPLNGTMNVIGNAEVYSSTPANITLAPKAVEDKKDDDKKDGNKVEEIKGPAHQPKARGREKSIEQIANEFMARSDKEAEESEETKSEEKPSKPITARQKKRIEQKKLQDEKKAKAEAEKKAAASEKIDKTVEKIKAAKKAKGETLEPPKSVEDKKPEEKKSEEKKPEEKKVEKKPEEKKSEDKSEAVDKKIDEQKDKVKDILEDITKKAKPTKKAEPAKVEIPKKEISDFKLRPAKKPPTQVGETGNAKSDAIKAILESLGMKAEKTNQPTKFVIKTSTQRNDGKSEVVDVDKLAQEIIEKADLDPKNLEKKEAAKKAQQLQEVAASKKDSEVMAILEEDGVKPKGAKVTPRVSFIKKDTH